MSNLILDLSNLNSGDEGFDPIPAGVYTAVVEDCTAGLSKAKGKPQLKLVWKLQGNQSHDGRMVFQYLAPTIDRAAGPIINWRFKQAAKAVGQWDENNLGGINLEEIACLLIGEAATLVLGIREATEQYQASNDIKKTSWDNQLEPGESNSSVVFEEPGGKLVL